MRAIRWCRYWETGSSDVIRFVSSRYFFTELSWTVRVRFPPHSRLFTIAVHFPRSGIRRYRVLHFVHRPCGREKARRFPIGSGRKWWTTMRDATSVASTARIRRASRSCASSFSSIDPFTYADVRGPAALLREERAAEVQQAVQQEEDGVLVAVRVPPAGRDQVRVVEPGPGLREPDHAAPHPAGRVGGGGAGA